MKCRRPFYNSSGRMLLHCLFCSECRRDRTVEAAVAEAVRQMRTTLPPPTPSDLHAKLRVSVGRQPIRIAPYLGLVLATGAAAVFAAVLVGGKSSRQGNEGLALRGSLRRSAQPSRDPGVLPPIDRGTTTIAKSGRRATHGNLVARGAITRSFAAKARVVEDDLSYLNPGYGSVKFGSVGSATMSKANLPAMRDDFVEPPALEFASIDAPEELAAMERDAMENYRQEASVVDSRLVHNVSISLKHASMTEACAELARQTGVSITAGRNVRDENVTLYVSPRPAREVMRQVSAVFGFIWEREGEEGRYSYRLKQDAASEVAEERLRNDDISAAVQSLAKTVKGGTETKNRELNICKQIFAELLPDELQRVESGDVVTMTTSGSGGGEDILDPQTSADLLGTMGGIRPWKDSYLPGRPEEPGYIPYTQMKDPAATVGFHLKISEFGGASLSADMSAHGSTGNFKSAGYGHVNALGSVKGVAEARVDNGKLNAAYRSKEGMNREINLSPRPTVPIAEQGEAPPKPELNTIASLMASYRLIKELQPPRPYMTSDDYWQAVHEATGRDVIADSFSRLFSLEEQHGTLFDVLCNGCDQMHYRWSLDSNFIVGRSRAYYWQRISEVPKSRLVNWAKQRRAQGFLPLEGAIEMSEMTDRQLDSIEVGKAIVNQWRLPEWGIPSRPMWTLHDPVRPILRQLAVIGPDKLALMKVDKLSLSMLSRTEAEGMSLATTDSSAILGVNYVPPGKYFWNPLFEMGKETVHTDLIIGDTAEEVETEVHKRYPERPMGEVTLSDGTLSLVVQTSQNSYSIGDYRFGVGHRGPVD